MGAGWSSGGRHVPGYALLGWVKFLYAVVFDARGESFALGFLRFLLSRVFTVYEFSERAGPAIDEYLVECGYLSATLAGRRAAPKAGWHLTLRPLALWYRGYTYKGRCGYIMYSPLSVARVSAKIPDVDDDRDDKLRFVQGLRMHETTEPEGVDPLLTERTWQTEVIDACLGSLTTAAVLVCGPPGVGKSSLGFLVNQRVRDTSGGARDPITFIRVHLPGPRDDGPESSVLLCSFPNGRRRVPHIVVLDEIDKQVATAGKLFVAGLMDVPRRHCMVIATTNAKLRDFEPWFLRRFHIWAEVTADGACRLHRGDAVAEGRAPAELLYDGETHERSVQ